MCLTSIHVSLLSFFYLLLLFLFFPEFSHPLRRDIVVSSLSHEWREMRRQHGARGILGGREETTAVDTVNHPLRLDIASTANRIRRAIKLKSI